MAKILTICAIIIALLALVPPLSVYVVLARLPISEHGADTWVVKATEGQRNGFFIEIGAADGLTISNTLLLEKKYSWTGLCIEPVLATFEALRVNRPGCISEHAVVGKTDGETVTFMDVKEDFYSTTSGVKGASTFAPSQAVHSHWGKEILMKTTSWKTLFEKHSIPKTIDFFSLDVEGKELELIEAFPFDEYVVGLMSVEHLSQEPMRSEIRKKLESHGLFFVSEAGPNAHSGGIQDDWYAHSSMYKSNATLARLVVESLHPAVLPTIRGVIAQSVAEFRKGRFTKNVVVTFLRCMSYAMFGVYPAA